MGNIQIKNVPEELHERARRKAAKRGSSLRDYVLDLIESDLSQKTFAQWVDEMESEPGFAEEITTEQIVESIRKGREERGEHLMRVLEESRQRHEGSGADR